MKNKRLTNVLECHSIPEKILTCGQHFEYQTLGIMQKVKKKLAKHVHLVWLSEQESMSFNTADNISSHGWDSESGIGI